MKMKVIMTTVKAMIIMMIIIIIPTIMAATMIWWLLHWLFYVCRIFISLNNTTKRILLFLINKRVNFTLRIKDPFMGLTKAKKWNKPMPPSVQGLGFSHYSVIPSYTHTHTVTLNFHLTIGW